MVKINIERTGTWQWVLKYSNGIEVRGFCSEKECELFYHEFPEGTGFEKHFINWEKKK